MYTKDLTLERKKRAMDIGSNELRECTINKILEKQDRESRWAFDVQVAREQPELIYYWPKYRSTLWTLLLLADLKAPFNNRQIDRSLHLVTDLLFDKTTKIFSLGTGHFPFPCLNGNILYLHFYFKKPYTKTIDSTITFFNSYQRFDDGDFKTPKTFPYYSNTACYGKHTCYWGVISLLRGLSFIPKSQRTKNAKYLLEKCIDFVLCHEVCFSSHKKEELIHSDIGALSFPNLVKADYLEILWLLARERIKDRKLSRALKLLQSKMNDNGYWELERPVPNLIVSMGRKGFTNEFITERAHEVLGYYRH
jgi:hypothetical protein